MRTFSPLLILLAVAAVSLGSPVLSTDAFDVAIASPQAINARHLQQPGGGGDSERHQLQQQGGGVERRQIACCFDTELGLGV
ncbi:hypothetical protein BC628DRAFT_1415510 [Trametes gibbosa]|nr:hypothetical protein BC628DRAFT_1415510 [Trametes gibbosa]